MSSEARARSPLIGPSPRPEAKKPAWLKTRLPSGDAYFQLKRQLAERRLSTICQSARCPNVDECWNQGHATFLAMGSICTRACGFCSVGKGVPLPLDLDEPERILEMASLMNLRYLVVTSVTRDDLPDGGSAHLGRIVRTLRENRPDMGVEVLIPDFDGNPESLDRVLDSGPSVLAHNLETVLPLYPKLGRPASRYPVSLSTLRYAHSRGAVTKSGLMVGVGETGEEIAAALADLRAAGTDLISIGQYLQPHPHCVPVVRYYQPEEFEQLKKMSLDCGFVGALAGPFVRTSYRAESLYRMVTHALPHIQ